jgi:hypothetical protein
MAIKHMVLSARDWWAENKKEKVAKHKALIKKLIALVPGTAVVIPPGGDQDAGTIAKHGDSFPIAGRKVAMMDASRCHWNVSKLFTKGKIDSICTGYALAADKGWRQHTWGLKNGKIVETTYKYQAYFGVELSEEGSAIFAEENE